MNTGAYETYVGSRAFSIFAWRQKSNGWWETFQIFAWRNPIWWGKWGEVLLPYSITQLIILLTLKWAYGMVVSMSGFHGSNQVPSCSNRLFLCPLDVLKSLYCYQSVPCVLCCQVKGWVGLGWVGSGRVRLHACTCVHACMCA